MSSASHQDIRTVALVIIRDRKLLMVTARNRNVVYMPGGKIDPGEIEVQALVREAAEEIGVCVDPATASLLFRVQTQAHGEADGRQVSMAVYTADCHGIPAPHSEVSAVHWVNTADDSRFPPAGRVVVNRLAALGLID